MRETSECSRVHSAVREDGALGDELWAHVRECSACAELVAAGKVLAGVQGEPVVDVDRMFSSVEAELARPVGLVERVRELSTRSRAAVLGGLAVGIVALAEATVRRIDFAIHPLPQLLGSIAVLLAAVVAAAAVVLRPIHRRPLPAWAIWALASFAVLWPIVIATLPFASQDHPGARAGIGDQLFAAASGCFVVGLTFALLLVGAAWWVERSGLRRRAAMVLGLVGAGALGNLVVILHCPIVAPVHRLLGHASIGVLLLAVGSAIWGWARRPKR